MIFTNDMSISNRQFIQNPGQVTFVQPHQLLPSHNMIINTNPISDLVKYWSQYRIDDLQVNFPF
jgi:hypothetical protein